MKTEHKVLNIRVSPSDLELLQTAAEDADIPVSTLCREYLRRTLISDVRNGKRVVFSLSLEDK